MTRLLLFFTVLLLVGGAASGLCWQLPASVRAAGMVSSDEQPAIKEPELNYLAELEAMKVGDAYPQRPAQFGSREEMLATIFADWCIPGLAESRSISFAPRRKRCKRSEVDFAN